MPGVPPNLGIKRFCVNSMGLICCASDDSLTHERTAEQVHVDGNTVPRILKLPSTYSISITKPPGSTLGLELDCVGPGLPRVIRIHPGSLMEEYNSRVKESEKVLQEDFLVEVNSVKGDTKAMLREVSHSTELYMLFQHPFLVEVAVARVADCYGLEISHTLASNGLVVLKVSKDGPFDRWNNDHADMQVLPGDLVVRVNGFQGTSEELLNVFQVSQAVRLLICRHEP